MEDGLTAGIEQIERITWSAPWLRGLQALAAPILAAPDSLAAFNTAAREKALSNHRGLPIRFVPQADLPAGMAYEAFISASGGVPTRNNLHDFFNALMWLAYPQIKVCLNALQAAELLKSAQSATSGLHPSGATRGKLRDAATLFDENAALFAVADDGLAAALCAHDWNALFVAQRTAFERRYSVRLFGHALLEKLVNPYKAITAHAWIVTVEPSFFSMDEAQQRALLDQMVCRRLEQGLTPADFSPLPVLGLPGWQECQDAGFYADQSVFRPRRKRIA